MLLNWLNIAMNSLTYIFISQCLYQYESTNVTMCLYRYFLGVVVFICVNKCDEVIPFCVFLVNLLARGWRDWFSDSDLSLITLQHVHLYAFGNFSGPINARFINHYQCMIFITRLTNFAEFTHIEETSCLCTTKFERLRIQYIR